jgi:site-specific DNA-adenine methylase
VLDTKITNLRPFFGYYGGKWRDAVKHYPPPTFRQIVEPFAGSAGYALRYPDRRVLLCEVDPVIAGVWEYLITVTPREVLAIPDVPLDGSVDDLKVCQEARWLVGFWMNRGVSNPRKRPSRWMRDQIRPGSFWGERVRQTIASQVEAIRHWKVKNCSYENCSVSAEATWFIDPPYELAGQHYRYGAGAIDYRHLAAWCRSRRGQVLVCENEGAIWLPFELLADVKTTRAKRRSREVLWMNNTARRSLPPSR